MENEKQKELLTSQCTDDENEEEDLDENEDEDPDWAGDTVNDDEEEEEEDCLLYTSPSPRDQRGSRMPSSA